MKLYYIIFITIRIIIIIIIIMTCLALKTGAEFRFSICINQTSAPLPEIFPEI